MAQKKVRRRIIQNDPFNSGSAFVSTGGITTITKDITGLTDLDLTGQAGELIVNLTSSNATETLNTISNYTNVRKITLRPAVGLTVTVNDCNALGGGTNIYLFGPLIACQGSAKGFVTLDKRGTDWYEYTGVDQYNPAG